MTTQFVSDRTVPAGWCYRGQGSTAFVKSPSGEVFRSRRQAFKEMVGAGSKHSVQEMLDMRTCLKYEGWEESKQIPQGWMINRKKKAIILMEQGGKSFNSVPEAMKFVKLYQKYYSPENLQLLQNLPNNNKNHPL